jgi:hypothetical protein
MADGLAQILPAKGPRDSYELLWARPVKSVMVTLLSQVRVQAMTWRHRAVPPELVVRPELWTVLGV